MVWNSVWPIGTISVSANQAPGNQNTAYIETNQKKDHFFNEGDNLDGRHRPINQQNVETDPQPSPGMNGVSYIKQSQGNQSQQFFNNGNEVMQVTPTLIRGTFRFPNSTQFLNIVSLNNDTFGTAWIFRGSGFPATTVADFTCTAGICHAFSRAVFVGGSSRAQTYVEFGNGVTSFGLNLRARSNSINVDFTYKVFYYNILP